MPKDNRYSRQSLIPGWDQTTLDSSTVILVGVGAIGSYVATILASSGIGKLVIIEFDTIELSNLNRQLLFRDEDLGKPKAEVASKRLKEINPEIEIEFHHKKMEEVNASVYERANVIIGCLDTFIGRRWISSMALRVKKPLILGGMFAFLGDVQVIIPYKTACFECQPLVPDEELAQACTPYGEERKKEREEEEEEAKLPAVATLSSIIGGMMAQESLKLILELGAPLENYMFYDGLNNATTIIPLARTEDCPACGELYKLEQIKFIAHPTETIKDLMLRLALTYGLEKPDLMVEGKLLDSESVVENQLKEKSIVYILDKNLAKPIKIVIKIEKL
ncbi:MAG: ThiF family adenylyltransferase [Candidatus Heimdallarchaeota archaeon]|nr:ThiF family adenylyltransferase [Candidatus Heimdallarchaeota archaeon]MCK4876354.1 ThiF family adenylyltransferase [Candidatus Heimdallarchaeota archaeon]